MECKKILIADDNQALLMGFRIQLEASGFDVITCTNGELAVAYAEKYKPDAILLDIRMNVEHRNILDLRSDGFGVLERIRKLPGLSDIPVIYITGDKSTQLDLRAHQLGAFGLLHKPISLPALLKMIADAISRRPQSTVFQPTTPAGEVA